MKEKKIRIITILLAIVTIIGLGFSIQKSYATVSNRKSDGQPDLDSYGYNVHPGHFEAKSTSNPWGLLEKTGYQIFCIEPHSPLNYTWHKELADMKDHVPHKREESHLWTCGGAYHIDQCDWTYGWDHGKSGAFYGDEDAAPDGANTGGVLSPIQVDEVFTADLSDYMAYIVSETPIGEWSKEKQLAVWRSRDRQAQARDGTPLDLDGGIIVGDNTPTHASEPDPSIMQEAIDYAIYNYDIKKVDDQKTEVGICPVQKTGGQGVVGYLADTDEYAAKYFSVAYVD